MGTLDRKDRIERMYEAMRNDNIEVFRDMYQDFKEGC